MLSELERRAWDTREKADAHKPEMALKVALDDIERGVVNPVHVIVVMVESVDDWNRVGYVQAGSLSELAIEGALSRAIRVAADNRK